MGIYKQYQSSSSSVHRKLRSGSCRLYSSNDASKDTVLEEIDPVDLTVADIMNFDLPTNDNNPNLLKIRHTTAHVMAMATQKLFPKIKVTIGPWIENGFYYDFFVPDEQLSESDLKRIKKEMDRIIRKDLPLRREEVSREEARERILKLDEPYKLELLESIRSEPITIFHVGDEWWDLCAGPHLESTGQLSARAIELQSLAGAYWRGDEKNAMLQRVYGTAWETPRQLKVFSLRQAEAKRRDHRLLGRALDLFSIQEDAGGGLVFWHPKGAVVRKLVEDYWKEQHLQAGYQLLYTPHIANLNLWKTSGHFEFYREDMFRPLEVEGEQYQLKPMNCPFHCLLYKDSPKSFRDLPLRWAELGTVYRYERSGTLHGLFRVRGFTQDDAHLFCLPEQLEDEIVAVLDLVQRVLGRFGFRKFDILLSTRPAQSVGSDAIWEKATAALTGALRRKQWPFTVDEGGGAFYGPKIDVKIQDAIGRKWQCSTVQCDFNLPDRFDLEYAGSGGDGARRRPIMVHRAIFGSLERFFGVLLESTAGDFPLWLAPTQLRLLPVVDEVRAYCEQVAEAARRRGLRVEVDRSGNRLAKLIRSAEQDKVPVTAVVGLKEREAGSLSLRVRKKGEIHGALEAFRVLDMLKEAADGAGDEEVDGLEAFIQKVSALAPVIDVGPIEETP